MPRIKSRHGQKRLKGIGYLKNIYFYAVFTVIDQSSTIEYNFYILLLSAPKNTVFYNQSSDPRRKVVDPNQTYFRCRVYFNR